VWSPSWPSSPCRRRRAAAGEELPPPYSFALELASLWAPSRRSRGGAMTAKTGRQPAPPLQLDAPPTSGEKKEEYRPSSRTPPWREARTPQRPAPAHARVQSRRGRCWCRRGTSLSRSSPPPKRRVDRHSAARRPSQQAGRGHLCFPRRCGRSGRDPPPLLHGREGGAPPPPHRITAFPRCQGTHLQRRGPCPAPPASSGPVRTQ
jgi:hypothetical protein